MTIEQRGVVDFYGVSKKHGTRILTISDHLEWSDYDCHSRALQDKVNDYLEYIYTNLIKEEHRSAGRFNIRIQLIMKHPPSAQALLLLNKIEGKLESLGFEFVHSVYRQE